MGLVASITVFPASARGAGRLAGAERDTALHREHEQITDRRRLR